MPGKRTPAPTPSSGHDLTLVPATGPIASPSPAFKISPVDEHSAAPPAASSKPRRKSTASRRIADSWGDDGSMLAAGPGSRRSIPALDSREARHELFCQCDTTNSGSVSLDEVQEGVRAMWSDLHHPPSLR